MGYVYFTEEQKERANTVDLKDFLVHQIINSAYFEKCDIISL